MTVISNVDFSSLSSSTSTSSASSSGSCQLSPSARALSTVLLALIGSIINGLSSGALVAFLTGWIAWLAVVRVVLSGLYEYWLVFKVGRDWRQAADIHEYETLPGGGNAGRPVAPPDPSTEWYGNGPANANPNASVNETNTAYGYDRNTSYSNGNMYGQSIPMTNFNQHNTVTSYPPPQQEQHQQRPPSPPPPPAYSSISTFFRPKGPSSSRLATYSKSMSWLHRGLVKDVTPLGWLGWIWSAFYTPISQSIWLAVNYNATGDRTGGIKIARAIAIGVSALPLAFDTRARYGAVLGRKLGTWAFVLFNMWNATVCLLLGAESAVLLVTGALEVDPPKIFFGVYPVFSIVWAYGSYKILPTRNASRKGVNIFVDFAVGAFAGIFVAAPAFAIWQNASFDARSFRNKSDPGGLSLGDYLSCEGAGVLDKFAAIMP